MSSSQLPPPVNDGTASSPERQPPPHRSPRKTPDSQRRPTKTRRGLGNINEDIMRPNADLGQRGNIDGEEINIPSNIGDLFNVDIEVENNGTSGDMNDADLLSALESFNVGQEETSTNSPTINAATSTDSVEGQPSHLQPNHPQITEAAKNRFSPKYEFTGSVPIPLSAGTPAGFKSPPTPMEEDAIMSLQGTYAWNTYRTKHAQKSRTEMVRGFDGPSNKGVEHLFDFVCPCRKCYVEMKIARVNGHILSYEKVDEKTGRPFQHSDHNVTNEEQKQMRRKNKVGGKATIPSAKSKRDDLSLTPAQHNFIREFGMGLVSEGSWKAIAEAMKASPKCSLTQAQENDIDGLAQRIKWYVARQRAKGDRFFVSQWGKQVMTGNQCKDILDALMTHPSERGETPPPHLRDIPFTHSSVFQDVWQKMVVVDHDYHGSGSTFTYILLEYVDADARAQRAVEMFLDNCCQIEMDFFLGLHPNNRWQVGQAGYSDLNHRYWITGVVIVLSENHQAASILLKHTLSLLQKAGGAGNRVLVDGGTALAKAVKNENELRQLLEDFVLVLRRCLAHCLRRPLSRGGGYQGGKGSVHNALIKNNVPRKVVGKIVGLLIMMTFIPPDKKESYGNAIDLLIQEYDKYLPPNFRATYLSKDPNDLGGLCAGRAGEVASTQGMERRGGYIKKCFRETCKSFGLGTKSGNPLMLISALAIDGMRNQNNIANIAVEPNRKKVASSYALLRTFANYRVPRPDDLLCNLRVNHNFCSDFLYCLCIATIINESGSPVETEVPLFSVLGKEDAEFKITFPSISAQCTELKQMKMEEVLDVIGGPAALQMQSMSAESVTTMLKDPRGCAKALTRLDYASQQTLKLRIHSRLRNNTSEPRQGETCEDFIRRHANRDESASAGTRFAKKFENRPGKKSKGKRSKQQDKLEEDKWGTNEDEEEAPAPIVDDAELEDTEKIIDRALNADDDIEGDVDVFKFDEKEIAILNSEADSEKRVRVLRELGEGVTVCVEKDCRKTCCNCEMFNRWRICRHVVWIEVLHFGKFPTGDISDAEDCWEDIKDRILDTIKKTHVDVSSM